MGFVAEESPSSLRHSVLHLWASIMDRSVTQACRAAPSSDKKARNCCSSVPCCTPGRRKVWVSLPKSPFILTSFSPTPTGNKNGLKCRLNVSYCTLGQRKWAEVLPESVVLHSRATKKRESVTQECRAALSGDEKCGFRCRRVPFILTSFCPTPTGNKNGRKCRLNVSCCTPG